MSQPSRQVIQKGVKTVLSKQQTEALAYFNAQADEWGEKAVAKNEEKFNVIESRNNAVLNLIKQVGIAPQSRLLDVGCGTGDLVCDAARLGLVAHGVDYSDEMIQKARQNAEKNNCQHTFFECVSAFDMQWKLNYFDVLSANGFIEYINFDELMTILELMVDSIKPSGYLCFSSRNRLFNIFSGNDYTAMEVDGGTLVSLINEMIQYSSIENISELELVDIQPQEKNVAHPKTNIDVSTRYQYTPGELIQLLERFPLKPIGCQGIHIHGVPLRFARNNKRIHASLAEYLEPLSENDLSFIPFASSFVLSFMKM